MSYASDRTDDQWALLEPVVNAPGRRVPRHAPNLRRVVDAMLEHLARQGVTERVEVVLVDCGVTAAGARKLGRRQGLEVRRVGWDDKQPVFRPIRHACRVEVARGRLGRARRLAKS